MDNLEDLPTLFNFHACSKCGEPAFGKYRMCQDCREENASKRREYLQKNPDYHATYLRDWNRKRRVTVIEHYGGECVCCRETTFEFLCINHKDGGGEKHRAEVGQGSHMVTWILDNNFPDFFNIMCHNCNQAIGYYGYCPHERATKLMAVEDE